jgi:1-acyl-sn-glycerol-3-phosphate acyltransferase
MESSEKEPWHSDLRVSKTINPFEIKPLKFSLLSKVKMLCVGCTLFPIRLCVLVTTLLSMSAFSSMMISFHDKRKPLPPWRRTVLMHTLKPSVRLVREESTDRRIHGSSPVPDAPTSVRSRSQLLWSLGYWYISVKRRPGAAKRGGAGVVIAAPHYSLIDAFVLCWLELPCSVAKAGVAQIPVFGSLARAVQVSPAPRACRPCHPPRPSCSAAHRLT